MYSVVLHHSGERDKQGGLRCSWGCYKLRKYPADMPTKTRPIEKFAKATAQCSAEVRIETEIGLIISSMKVKKKINSFCLGGGIWQMCSRRLQFGP